MNEQDFPAAAFDVVVSPETGAVREAVRALAERMGSDELPLPDRTQFVADGIRTAAHGIGILAPVADELGGSGIPDPLMWSVIAEELGAGDAGAAYEITSGASAWLLVDRCGSRSQRQRWAAEAQRRPVPLGSLLYYEAFGRGPSELATVARRRGDSWLLSGVKSAVTRADEADLTVVIARSADGLTAFALPGRDLPAPRGENGGRPAGTLGLRGARLATVTLDELVVPADAALAANQDVLHRGIAAHRLTTASIAIGVARAALHYASAYVQQRQAFGSAVSTFQGVSFPLAEVDVVIDSARLELWSLLSRLDEWSDPIDLDRAVSETVARATAVAVRASIVGLNSLGGHGYLTDHPQERAYRDAGVLAALDFDVLHSNWDAVPTA